jgi:hypothetical protein
MDAKSQAGVIAFPARNHLESVRDNPKCPLPQNMPHGKQRLELVRHLRTCSQQGDCPDPLSDPPLQLERTFTSSLRVRPHRVFTSPH